MIRNRIRWQLRHDRTYLRFGLSIISLHKKTLVDILIPVRDVLKSEIVASADLRSFEVLLTRKIHIGK